MVYEGEQEGPYNVALHFLSEAVKRIFLDHFPNPDKIKRERDPYDVVTAYFSGGNVLTLNNDSSEKEYTDALDQVAGLDKLVKRYTPKWPLYFAKEIALYSLTAINVLTLDVLKASMQISDPLADVLSELDEDD